MEAVVAKKDGVVAAIEHTFHHGALEAQAVYHAFFDGVFRNEVKHLYGHILSDAIDAADALFQNGRIPRKVEVDENACCLQVETYGTRIGGKEDAAVAFVPESLYEFVSLCLRHVAVQVFISDASCIEFHCHQSGHSLPFAEHDYLCRAARQGIFQDAHRLCHLHVVPVLFVLVDDESAVGKHAHLSEHEQQPTAFLFAQTVGARPFAHQPCHSASQFFVPTGLFRCHGDEQELVGTLGQLQLYALFCTADEGVLQSFSDVVQVLISYRLACFGVCDDVVVTEPIERGEQIRVGKLYDGTKFVEIVLERSAGKEYAVVRVDAAYCPSWTRVPVLQPLHFVHDEQVCGKAVERLHVVGKRLIGHYLVRGCRGLIEFQSP